MLFMKIWKLFSRKEKFMDDYWMGEGYEYEDPDDYELDYD